MKRTKRLAEQIKETSGLMGGLVLAYQHRHGMDDEALISHLKIDADALARLILARRPRPERKVQDILNIASTVGCEAALLWSIVDQALVPSPDDAADIRFRRAG